MPVEYADVDVYIFEGINAEDRPSLILANVNSSLLKYNTRPTPMVILRQPY